MLDATRIETDIVLAAMRACLMQGPSSTHIRDAMYHKLHDPWWSKSAVHRKLIRLEKAGYVERLPTCYRTQIAWGIVPTESKSHVARLSAK